MAAGSMHVAGMDRVRKSAAMRPRGLSPTTSVEGMTVRREGSVTVPVKSARPGFR